MLERKKEEYINPYEKAGKIDIIKYYLMARCVKFKRKNYV